MSTKRFTGQLLDPIDQAPDVGASLRFTALSVVEGMITGAVSEIDMPPMDASYDFTLNYGKYRVEYKTSGYVQYRTVATVVVHEETTATTIPELLGEELMASPANIVEMRSLLTESQAQVVLATEQVTLAAAEANRAETEANRADSEADKAHASAVAAETSKNQAAEITGLDTVEDAVELALSESNSMVMGASERAAILAANEEKYAASGFVHYGKHHESSTRWSVNEGLWGAAAVGLENAIAMGRDGSTFGTSKTDYPVSHIAGVVSGIGGVGYGAAYARNYFKFPEAPDGTVIYDSSGDARGTGKANLNLLTEVDPKYGDVAVDTNEAVARAFEGDVKNGDARLGTDHWLASATTFEVEDGWFKQTQNSNWSRNSQKIYTAPEYDKELVVKFEAYTTGTYSVVDLMRTSTGTPPQGSAAHKRTTLSKIPTKYSVNITGTGETDLWFNIGSQDVGDVVKIRNISIKPVTEEVVTDRVDMFGLEQFDMVIKDDEVFDMVQSQSNTFGDTDVPTVDSIRPDSFFAVYDGQTDIAKGKCVKWSTLTDTQKRKVAGYMKERLWVNEDGDLTFTTIRQRSFAGAGNGDWGVDISLGGISSNEDQRLICNIHSFVTAQGDADTVSTYHKSTNSAFTFCGRTYPSAAWLGQHKTGVFRTGENGKAHKGRCFFYVLGSCSRLNFGLYHPSLNESGCAADINGKKWYDTSLDFSTQADCFNLDKVSHD